MQRKQVIGSKLGAPGAGPLKATGLSRPGGNKTTPRLTPKERKIIFSLPYAARIIQFLSRSICL